MARIQAGFRWNNALPFNHLFTRPPPVGFILSA
jgi:hypothetical protein